MLKINTRVIALFTMMLISSLTSFGQNVRGFYLQDVGTWLGNTTKENDILNYAQGNGFNYILFYDLGNINWTNATNKNQLAAFIRKARTSYGIVQVGGVVEYSGYVSQNLIPYNNSRSSNLEKFDVINLEFEFWVSSSISSSYCSKFLAPQGFACNTTGAWAFAWRELKSIDALCAANGMMSEMYLGWPSLSQMQQIASRADRILLSAYRPTDSDIYLYSKQRMKDIATIGGTTKVMTLLSSESAFMGPWLNTHPQTRPFQTMKSELTAETGTFKQNIDLQGYQWFTYKYMPKTILATATISATGPLTFCPGESVTLTANSGSAYLWSPNGETTQSIVASNSGSYTVRVTNSAGVAIISAPTVVSSNGTGAIPIITASGPTSFCPGGSVTLTSTPGSSYLWTDGQTTQTITVDVSGFYEVTTGSGACMQTSDMLVINATSAPAKPTVTASGSLNACPGTLLTLTSSPANGYLWSNGSTTRSIVVANAGDYTVTAYAGPSCFAQSDVSTIVQLTAPATPTITASGSLTLNSSHPSVQLTSSIANSYTWNTAASTRAITVTSQGNYRVTVTGSNGCQATSSDVAIIANGCTPPPTPTITLSGSNVITSGQNVTLTSSVAGGYLWSNGALTRTITVNAAGTYTVRNYNAGGCFSTSLPVTIAIVAARVANTTTTDIPSASKDNFSVYPNPAKEQVNVYFNTSTEKNINVKLIDMSGRELQSIEKVSSIGENHIQMDVSSLSHGIYFAYLISDDQKQVIKVVIE